MHPIVEQGGERYIHATAIARLLGISRPLFYVNVQGLLDPQRLVGRKRIYYNVKQVEQKCNVNVP